LTNKGPCTTLDVEIFEDTWTCKYVNYSFLKAFGCEAYAHMDKEYKKKLDAKS